MGADIFVSPRARRLRRRLAFIWALSANVFSTGAAFAFQRNCPAASDMLVVVQPPYPATFTLPVVHADGSAVTVLEQPPGGALHPTGPTSLDYVFVPDETFTGHSTMRYRVVPPQACGEGTMIGTISFAGGSPKGDPGLFTPLAAGACGGGAMAVTMMAVAGVSLVVFAQRRRP